MTTTVEQTECSIPRVYVFNVPPRASSTGHRAADWPKDPLWSGRLRLVTAGDTIAVLLEHTDKDGLFARCPVDAKSTVEQVTDSSRYFVIRVSDGHGHTAYLGVAFGKKEEAWDFKVALQTSQNRNASDQKASAYFAAQPAVDMTLPAGGQLEVDLGGKFAKKKAADAAAGAASGATPSSSSGSASGGATVAAKTGGGFALAPPKASEKKGRKAAHAAATGAAANTTATTAAATSTSAAAHNTPAPAKPAAAAGKKSAPPAAAPVAAAASSSSASLETDATLLEAFGAAPPAAAVSANAPDPMAFFSSGK